MPHHDTVALSGAIQNVFAHRFTVLAGGKVFLADLGPKGAEAFELAEGLEVELQGEQRPSEIKVTEISAKGRPPVVLHHKKPHHEPGRRPPHERGLAPHHEAADPALALSAAAAAGWTVQGEPCRKPKHFELLARQGQGGWAELHVDLDGGLYKVKAVPPDGGKWADRIG